MVVIWSSVVYADDQSQKITQWVPVDAAAEIAVAGALYNMKPNQLEILEKVNPGLKNLQTLAQEADANSKAAYSKASQYKDSFSGVFNKESSARLDEYEILMHKGEYWRAEQRKFSALFKREVEATVQKMRTAPYRATYKRYLTAGAYNKWIRPIGAVVLLGNAIQNVDAVVGTSEIKTGQSMASKASIVTTLQLKPVTSNSGNYLPAVEAIQNTSANGSAK